METSKLEWKNKYKKICLCFVSVFTLVNGSATLFALLVTKHAFPNNQLFRAQTYMCLFQRSRLPTQSSCVSVMVIKNKKGTYLWRTMRSARVTIAAMEKRHYEYVSVSLVIWHAKNMRHIILSSVASLALPYFSTLSYELYDFPEKKYRVWIYNVYFDFLYKFSLKHFSF